MVEPIYITIKPDASWSHSDDLDGNVIVDFGMDGEILGVEVLDCQKIHAGDVDLTAMLDDVKFQHTTKACLEAQLVFAKDAIASAVVPLEALHATEMNSQWMCNEIKNAITKAVKTLRSFAAATKESK